MFKMVKIVPVTSSRDESIKQVLFATDITQISNYRKGNPLTESIRFHIFIFKKLAPLN